MRRIMVILLLLAAFQSMSAVVWHNVNIDKVTATAMTAAYVAEGLEEQSSANALDSILSHYKSAGIAVAGIYVSKKNDRDAMRNPGLFATEENYYYTRILRLVKDGIMPMFITVAAKMVKYPENAIYWGPYLYNTTNNVENLCKEFELVVTNGRLSFKDVQFLLINDELRKIFDLAELANMDWKSLLDKLGDFGKDLTMDDLKDDMKTLGNVLSQAGQQTIDSNLQKASKIGEVFHSSPNEIWKLYDEYRGYYEDVKRGANIKDVLMQVIVTPDAAGVAKLFKVDDYNLTGYISNYIKELQGQYYTQRWYIYSEDSGTKEIASYRPSAPANTNNEDNWTGWIYKCNYEKKSTPPFPSLTTGEYNQLKAAAESATGWNATKKTEFETNNPGHTIYLNYENRSYDYVRDKSGSLSSHSKHWRGRHFTVYLTVTDSWYIKNEVYEEVFDSQSMDKETFEAKLKARLKNYNDNLDPNDENYGRVYKLGSDAPRYYTMADQKKMEGCNSVSFVANCSGGTNLAEGSFNWKENGKQGDRLEDPKSKDFAMSNNPEIANGDEELLDYQKQYTSEAAAFKQQISQNDVTMQNIIDKIYQAKLAGNTALVNQLQQEYDGLSDKNAQLRDRLATAQSNLNKTNAALEEYYKDMGDNLDGAYRIPSNMAELQSMYKLQWQDNGEWVNGSDEYLFVRHAYCPSINTVVTYTASLKLSSKPKYFLGIRIHRAILSVDFKLSSSSNSENVIEVMKLDMNKSEKERAEEVNARLKELLADMPDCSISVKYEYAQSIDNFVDDDEDGIHLLWANDRLDIARDVEYQLTSIYAQLVLLDKVMQSRHTLQDFLKRQILDVVSRSARGTIAEFALQRWEDASLTAMKKANEQNGGEKKDNDKNEKEI